MTCIVQGGDGSVIYDGEPNMEAARAFHDAILKGGGVTEGVIQVQLMDDDSIQEGLKTADGFNLQVVMTGMTWAQWEQFEPPMRAH